MEGVLPYDSVAHKDVFVFKFPKDPTRDFIKRVIGLGDDRVEIRHGQVIRNEQLIDEPYIFIKGSRADFERDEHAEVRVPPSHYFAMGDNRLNSDDSRFWGTVPGSHVKGRALLIYWSFVLPDDLKVYETKNNPTAADKTRVLRYVFWHFLTETRWGRTFKLVR